jgi:hypothetical protein
VVSLVMRMTTTLMEAVALHLQQHQQCQQPVQFLLLLLPPSRPPCWSQSQQHRWQHSGLRCQSLLLSLCLSHVRGACA